MWQLKLQGETPEGMTRRARNVVRVNASLAPDKAYIICSKQGFPKDAASHVTEFLVLRSICARTSRRVAVKCQESSKDDLFVMSRMRIWDKRTTIV